MTVRPRRSPEEKLAHDNALLPYPRESNEEMQRHLDLYLTRLAQAVQAQDYDPGVLQADAMVLYWLSLKYPLPKEKRVRLVKLYYELAVTPGMPWSVVASSVDRIVTLVKSEHEVTIDDLRLPWKPIYRFFKKNLFLSRRQFELNTMPVQMGTLAEACKRFFHPAETDEMLEEFVPGIIGAHLDTILEAQYYMFAFLPLSHPTSWLPMIFTFWEAFNSSVWDARAFQLLSQLCQLHVDPTVSDPKRLTEIPDDALEEGAQRVNWNLTPPPCGEWKGLFKDVGIFSDEQWNFMMIKCLATMSIPLADSGSLSTGITTDSQASFEIARLPPPLWEIHTLSRIIVYSMAKDAPASAPSGISTPWQPPAVGSFARLGAQLQPDHPPKQKTYLGGSKALESFARLVISTESFFHPNNSGSWTVNLSGLVRHVVNQFSKRWAEEQDPECKTPPERRLTTDMKRELVMTVKTPVLLAMFSKDPSTFDNVMSTIKAVCSMEPDLMIMPILERAGDALETLTETDRTTAVISALSACGSVLVSREIFPAGAKHLLTILELCVPGIDLNDPSKTTLTTNFLLEVLQHIKIGDLTIPEQDELPSQDKESLPSSSPLVPTVSLEGLADGSVVLPEIDPSADEEDALLRESTSRFANWLSNFFARVFLLMENLPEENDDSAGESLLDTVFNACNQICVHLSEPLFDFVLNLVFDYVTTNVRANAARSVNGLISCVAHGDYTKTFAKFWPHCSQAVRVELENGASSLRTTQWGQTRSSDATFHWNLSMIRGLMDSNGEGLLPYRADILSLLDIVNQKSLSKQGFTWSGELLSDVLLALTHTYPQDSRFVNPETWNSQDFKKNHHRYWGKNYRPDEVVVEWHVPSDTEVEFALEILQKLVQPSLSFLEDMFDDGVVRDAVWRNDVCRHLNFVRNGFIGIPTLWKEVVPLELAMEIAAKGDVLDELPEFITHVPSISSGFVLEDPKDPRYQFISNLRRRFGDFLHKASLSLRTQGDENTVDAVHMLVKTVSTYLLDYGDSIDDYKHWMDKYTNEKRIARLVPIQKVWPRLVWVRRARYLHASRLRWNTLERIQGPLEESLIDDILEWGLWIFPTVRESAQGVLSMLCNAYDGIRRRSFPVLYRALQPGGDIDRMKGALFILNFPAFARYASTEPQMSPEFIRNIFACQREEKPSIQDCISAISENSINTITEPNFLIYSISTTRAHKLAEELLAILPQEPDHAELIQRCTANRVKRVKKIDDAVNELTTSLIHIAEDPSTHWRYTIMAIRFLRTLTRRDAPANGPLTRWLFDAVINPNPRVRYYAQRSIQKGLRFIKFRTFCETPLDLVTSNSSNPYKRVVPTEQTEKYTQQYLTDFRKPFDRERNEFAQVQDKVGSGWIAWRSTDVRYVLPQEDRHISEWEPASREAVAAVHSAVSHETFWKKYSDYLSEETQSESTSQDTIFCVKSIFQLLGDSPLEFLRPVLDELLRDEDMNKQRAAAELLAGVVAGSKHWSLQSQRRLWDWLTVQLPATFATVKTDTLVIWCSFITTVTSNRDPRRMRPLMDYIIRNGLEVDFNDQSSFQVVKMESFVRSIDADLGWRFTAWTDDFFDRYWEELASEHEEVRAYIAEAFTLYVKLRWRPRSSTPSTKAFVQECQDTSSAHDLMGLGDGYNVERVLNLLDKFPQWREERLPGAMAPFSTYDKVGGSIVRFLFNMLHDINAAMAFQYILPLIPELFRMLIMEDSIDLAARAAMLLVRMNGIPMPKDTIQSVLQTVFEVIRTSTSWKVRLYALPGLQVLYFRQLPSLSDETVEEILAVLEGSLMDEIVEVRQAAADTLSGILRCSPRQSVLSMKDRFVARAESTPIPSRSSPSFATSVRTVHSAVLGVSALLGAYPYTVPSWGPNLILFLEKHAYDPVPISTTVTETARSFKKTHLDTWREDEHKFNEEQISALSTLLTGSSYYA